MAIEEAMGQLESTGKEKGPLSKEGSSQLKDSSQAVGRGSHAEAQVSLDSSQPL